MKKVKRLSWLVCFLTVLPTPILAGYPDPVLRVLLLQTQENIVLQNRHGLQITGATMPAAESVRLVVQPVDQQRIRLNDRIVSGSVYIDARGAIELHRRQSAGIRRYLGSIEIRPYAQGIYVINHIPTETYLEGVINAEIDSNWPIEVVKAQAVISRTFALYKRAERDRYAWHLTSGHYDQVYKGMNIADARGRFAIQATRGIVVAYQGRLAQTFYHSNCGGVTEDPQNIWRVGLPYLRSQSIPYGRSDPRYHWEVQFSDREIINILRRNGITKERIENIFVSRRMPSERVFELTVVGDRTATLTGYDFRRYAGYDRVQSLLFDIIRIPGGYYLKGRGNGHGVGLSQWAAKEMAENGYRYQDILDFFYHDVTLMGYKD